MLRAIMVSVDYSDLLAMTLPYNRHHFSEVMVVTTPEDVKTQEVAAANGATVFATRSFYDRGASFNKWVALEQGLNAFGRSGWLCVMDADVVWPKALPAFERKVGKLYSPLRRMREPLTIPPENEWAKFPIHRNVTEWAGYSQIFHADDPVLGPPPWHEVDWKHAGGADSFFQRKWAPENKVRPPFEVLHLGEAGRNWFGRATRRADGSIPAEAEARSAQVGGIWRKRDRSLPESLRFAAEKIDKDVRVAE